MKKLLDNIGEVAKLEQNSLFYIEHSFAMYLMGTTDYTDFSD